MSRIASAELAQRIPGAGSAALDRGHFLLLEKPELVHEIVEAFITKHDCR